ncbi:MAG: SUMF1/EgtB/PvdO family nonheme iron enzyme, partial [Myxococcota bacterium]
RQLWCPGFAIDRDPVTNEEYARFLASLSRSEAEHHVPRRRPDQGKDQEEASFAWLDGQFVPRSDMARHPVTNVDWESAMAYLRWRARSDGKPWRLPGDLEWEKAARGVDGRVYPWGRMIDPSWCCMFASHRGAKGPAAVDGSHSRTDVSPYGVRGLGGNVRDWCYDTNGTWDRERVVLPPRPVPEGQTAIVRGGTWLYGGNNSRATSRPEELSFERHPFLGFRGAYPLGPFTRPTGREPRP